MRRAEMERTFFVAVIFRKLGDPYRHQEDVSDAIISALCQRPQTQRGTGSINVLPLFTRQKKEDSRMNNGEETFNAQAEVERIRARRAEARRRLYRKSRLDRYRAELVAMKQVGASCADLVEWLRINHRCRINRSTVDRYLKKLPELRDDDHRSRELRKRARGRIDSTVEQS